MTAKHLEILQATLGSTDLLGLDHGKPSSEISACGPTPQRPHRAEQGFSVLWACAPSGECVQCRFQGNGSGQGLTCCISHKLSGDATDGERRCLRSWAYAAHSHRRRGSPPHTRTVWLDRWLVALEVGTFRGHFRKKKSP